jgi:hypothetical protein
VKVTSFVFNLEVNLYYGIFYWVDARWHISQLNKKKKSNTSDDTATGIASSLHIKSHLGRKIKSKEQTYNDKNVLPHINVG